MNDADLLDEGEFEDDDIPQLVVEVRFIPPPEVRSFIGYRREEKYSYNSAIRSLLRSIRVNKER